jgi:curved DNA-binding protein CbpA
MATPTRDYYAILGLAPTAGPAEIGGGRRLAREHHPACSRP